MTAAAAAGMIPAHAWHRMRTGSGTKGTRHYDWAMLEVTSDDTPGGHDGGHSVLLARRHRYTGTAVVLPVLDTRPGPAVPADRHRGRPLANRGRSPARQAEHRPGRRAGHPLEILAPLDRALPARLHLPRRRRSPATPARGRLDLDAGLIPITVPELLRLLRDTVIPPPRRDRAHRLHWSDLATPPPAPRPPSPPTLERLRRDNTMITTNYSCRN